MDVNEFVEKYNFHDCRAYNFNLSKENKTFEFFVDENKHSTKKVVFAEVSNFKCLSDISKIDDYLLNIWKTKHSKNDVEIIFDNDTYTAIYFSSKNVEVINIK